MDKDNFITLYEAFEDQSLEAQITRMCSSEDELHDVNLLEVGHAVVALKERVFVPLHVRVPLIKVRKGVVQDEALANHRGMKGANSNRL